MPQLYVIKKVTKGGIFGCLGIISEKTYKRPYRVIATKDTHLAVFPREKYRRI